MGGLIMLAALLQAVALLFVGRQILMANQDVVNEITAQLNKASGEIVAKIDELEAQLENGEEVDFTELRAAAQALDDVVPDAVPEEPVEEPQV